MMQQRVDTNETDPSVPVGHKRGKFFPLPRAHREKSRALCCQSLEPRTRLLFNEIRPDPILNCGPYHLFSFCVCAAWLVSFPTDLLGLFSKTQINCAPFKM
jgi:hypothetical protein